MRIAALHKIFAAMEKGAPKSGGNAAKTTESFLPYCIKCSQSRLPSSSNRNFNFDYCTHCKQMSTFEAAPSASKADVSKRLL